MKRFSKLSITLLSLLSIVTFSAPAFAETTATGSSTTKTEQSVSMRAKEKLAEAKTKACDTRKNAVTTIEKRVANRGQARLDAITKIATKVENYVQTNNLTVTNYDGLVSTINTKKVAAQAALDTTKNDRGAVAGVTCQNGEGKAKVEAFKKDMKAQQEALTAYRQSVKALITAVKAAKTSTGGTQQ